MSNRILHVYAQQHEHDDLVIVGTRDALEILRYAIERTLQPDIDHVYHGTVFQNDGEGYSIRVQVVDESQVRKLRPAYAEDRKNE